MIRKLSLLALMIVFIGTTNADAAKRVALVIGNSAYEHAPELANPANDAEDISSKLKTLDFDVIEGRDLTLIQLRNQVRLFINKLSEADIGLFYYAGHGLQVNGNNYLAPIDAKLQTHDDLEFEAMRIEFILSAMERKTETNLVFLDACRNNPLARNLARSMGTRSTDVGRGLARISSGVGTLISFSTQPGNVALDGAGRNSPFTAALVKHIGTPGEDITRSMRKVRNEVLKTTDGKQVPWENSSLTGDIVLEEESSESSLIEKGPDQTETIALKKQLEDLRKRLEESANNSALSTNTDDSRPVDLDLGERKKIQIALAQMGFDPGPADGQFGPRTRNAISEARRNFGLSEGEFVDSALLTKLPEVSSFSASPTNKARRYTVSELPESVDPRLSNAVGELANYEIRFGYHNGRLYIAVLTYGHAWEESRTLAERAGGNLVAITSRAENAFVYRLFASDDRFVHQRKGGDKVGPWIGLYQTEVSDNPSKGWRWANGESIIFNNWIEKHPNNRSGEVYYAKFHSDGRSRRPEKWANTSIRDRSNGFIMEIE